jgi:hypothetical protein
MVSFMGAYAVWSIYVRSDNGSFTNAPALDHVDQSSSMESINKRLGPASTITPSDDQLSRNFAYRRYTLRVSFAQGTVKDYGIYHPKRMDFTPWAPGSKRVCVDMEGKDVG